MEPFIGEIRLFPGVFQPLFDLIAQVMDAIVAVVLILY